MARRLGGTETEPLALVDAVIAFRGRYWPLSNFYPRDIVVDDATYTTVEHYFQAAKALHPDDRERIRTAATPAVASPSTPSPAGFSSPPHDPDRGQQLG